MHELFHPSKLDQLPYQIREQARAVARGSLPALTAVHAFRNFLSVPQQLLLAPIYYSILDVSHLDSISTLDWDSDAETVHLRLSAVLSAMDSMINLIEYRIPAPAMDEIWVRIWAWMQFVDDFREQLSLPLLQLPFTASFPFNPSDIGPHQHLFPQILLSYLIEGKPAAFDFLQSNPRIFTIVGRAWTDMLLEEAVDHNRQWQVRHSVYAASFSLLRHGHELLRRDGPHMEQLLDGVGGTWGHLASLLTRHLQQSIPDPLGTPQSRDIERVYGALEFLREKDGDPRHELRAALINEGIVATLTGLSLRLVNTPYAGQAENIKTPGTNFHALIAFVLLDARSELRLVEALHAGLLRSLVAYATVAAVITCEILWWTEPDISSRLEFRGIAYISPSCGPCAWRLRRSQSSIRRSTLIEWDWGKSGPIVRLRISGRQTRCAGCQDAWFCSRECQKADWQNGHRKDCKILRDAFIEYSSNLKPADRAFHRALLNVDYATRLEEITGQLIPYIKLNNSIESHPILVIIHYRSTMRMRGFLLRFAEPELYVGLRAYTATCKWLEDDTHIVIADRRRIQELLPLAGRWTH
ncbi:hypothetical protein C8F01DRAFT_1252625 [Mycena amicta]|nr:hypothetical protein C8F01DRAFT_1252625 [Mycena amicta]